MIFKRSFPSQVSPPFHRPCITSLVPSIYFSFRDNLECAPIRLTTSLFSPLSSSSTPPPPPPHSPPSPPGLLYCRSPSLRLLHCTAAVGNEELLYYYRINGAFRSSGGLAPQLTRWPGINKELQVLFSPSLPPPSPPCCVCLI